VYDGNNRVIGQPVTVPISTPVDNPKSLKPVVKDPSGKEIPPGLYSVEIYSSPEKIAEIPVEAAQSAVVRKPV